MVLTVSKLHVEGQTVHLARVVASSDVSGTRDRTRCDEEVKLDLGVQLEYAVGDRVIAGVDRVNYVGGYCVLGSTTLSVSKQVNKQKNIR
jgi:hypothetical protein